MIVDLFAGPGGWDTGLRWAGYTGRLRGFEWDTAACATASAAGHERVQADIAELDPAEAVDEAVSGLIGSPPCGPFSMSGNGAGRRELSRVLDRITAYAAGQEPDAAAWEDPRTPLCAEPMRWAMVLRPRWIALEQVTAVLPVWQHMAVLLRELGYRTWVGPLDAEMYGVPQTRDRAVLVASLDGPVGPPVATHQRYVANRAPQLEPDLFGELLPPPISMFAALGWGLEDRPAWTVSGGGTKTGGAEVFANAACRARLAETVAAKWKDRPATTVCGDPRIAPPGHKDRAGGEPQFGDGTVRVTPAEAGILQSFPADYPWQGNAGQRHQQAGDAVPPLLAMHILAPLLAISASSRAS